MKFDFKLNLPKESVGLDISLDNVKLVRLRKVGDKVILKDIGLLSISPYPLGEENIEKRRQETINALRSLAKQYKLKEVRSAVSGSAVVVRYLRIPYTPEAELRKTVKYTLEDHIPFDVKSTIVDFAITKEVTEGPEVMMELVLVSVKEEVIYEHLDLIKKGGVTTWNINVETFAVEDSYTLSPNYEPGKEEVIALIDIGARITNMNILENGISVFNRDIMIGGNDFTEAIRKELGLLDFPQAEEMKLTIGSLAVEDRFRSQRAYGDGERFMGVYYAIEPVATRLLDELDRSFAYYYTQLPSYKKSIDKVILSGGGAALKGLDTFLKEGLNMALEYNDPFGGIEIPPTLPNITLVEKEKLRFATACGLARRGLL